MRHGHDGQRVGDATGGGADNGGGGGGPTQLAFRAKPYFDTQIHPEPGLGARNITTVEGGKAILVCTVKNLGPNRTVSHATLSTPQGNEFSDDSMVNYLPTVPKFNF